MTSTLNDCKYFLTIVDDFSRATWSFLILMKDKVYSIFTHFLILVKNQFNQTVKIARANNSTKLFNQKMHSI